MYFVQLLGSSLLVIIVAYIIVNMLTQKLKLKTIISSAITAAICVLLLLRMGITFS